MTNDTLNGARMIIEEMREELNRKSLSQRDRLYLKSSIYTLTLLSSLRGDVEVLKKHDLIGWTSTYPKAALFFLLLTVLVVTVIDPQVLKSVGLTLVQFFTGINLK